MRTVSALLLAATLTACGGDGPACNPVDVAEGEVSVGGAVTAISGVVLIKLIPADAPGGPYLKALGALIGAVLIGAMAGLACEEITEALDAPSPDEARHGLHKGTRLAKQEDATRTSQGP